MSLKPSYIVTATNGGLGPATPTPPFTFDQQWTIGNSGDDYGFNSTGLFGSITPGDWFDMIDTIDILMVDDSADAVIFRSALDDQWDGQTNVTIQTEGFANVSLTWNGTFYAVIDSAYTAYIVGQNGNTLGVNIIPRP